MSEHIENIINVISHFITVSHLINNINYFFILYIINVKKELIIGCLISYVVLEFIRIRSKNNPENNI